MVNICAGIVLYNPDMERLNQNIEAIQQQVEMIFLFDNGSKNQRQLQMKYSKYDNIVFLYSTKNTGVAHALNRLCRAAARNEFQWILTLDQDSICPEQMIRKMMQYIYRPNIAIITSRIQDRNRAPLSCAAEMPYCEEISECITSGSLTNISVFQQVGGFNDALFIDEVDTDFCIRCRMAGYKILRINTIVLLHEFGTSAPVYIFRNFGKIFHIRYLERPKYTGNYSDFRKYHMVRNSVYLLRKYPKKYRKGKLWKLFKVIALWYLGEHQFLKNSVVICKGIIDGIKFPLSR